MFPLLLGTDDECAEDIVGTDQGSESAIVGGQTRLRLVCYYS